MNSVLYVTSELYPLVKTGGLADVSASLPAALAQQSLDIRILLPAYPEVIRQVRNPKLIAIGNYYKFKVRLLETRLPTSNVIIWLVDCPALFDRPGGPYIDENGQSWDDNALRFALLCKVAVDIALHNLDLNWIPDIVHGNDWQSGLISAWLHGNIKRPATVFTVHNLAYQGLFDYQTFLNLDLPSELWTMNGLEFYGQLSFIKGGLVFSDRINTVSPTYAQEIQRPEYGCGLEGLLTHRQARLSGILNGIDTMIWNPQKDEYLQTPYGRHNLQNKTINKTFLKKQLGLPISTDIPLIGMISRMVKQKGLDIILECMSDILAIPVQLVILGTGDIYYEMELTELARRHPERLKVIIGYNEELSHQIEAGSDLFLMPSAFEPCGLNQIYSLRYGTLPIVRNVGGLADTVVDASREHIKEARANGFVVKAQTAAALLATIKRAVAIYQQPVIWHQLQQTAMGGDFSWRASAAHYMNLYRLALVDRDKAVS